MAAPDSGTSTVTFVEVPGAGAHVLRRYRAMQKTTMRRELKAAEEAFDDEDGLAFSPAAAASKVSSLLDRGMLRLLKRNYDGSREYFVRSRNRSSDTEAATPPAADAEAPPPPPGTNRMVGWKPAIGRAVV
ncbi:unnamed protein product [Pylaiella littoralis]